MADDDGQWLGVPEAARLLGAAQDTIYRLVGSGTLPALRFHCGSVERTSPASSSCSHSGAVNVLHNARRAKGLDRIHSFVGGLHLSGAAFERIIPDTVAHFASIAPAVVVPGHCTGWRATHELVSRPARCVRATSVGTRLRFAASG